MITRFVAELLTQLFYYMFDKKKEEEKVSSARIANIPARPLIDCHSRQLILHNITGAKRS
jgi:hypothetical protein